MIIKGDISAYIFEMSCWKRKLSEFFPWYVPETEKHSGGGGEASGVFPGHEEAVNGLGREGSVGFWAAAKG